MNQSNQFFSLVQLALVLLIGIGFVSGILGQQNAPASSSSLLASQSPIMNVNGLPVLVQITYVGPPKILPIATAESYPEGSSINLICTVSGGQRKGLHLSWIIQGHQVDQQTIQRNGINLPENLSIGQDGSDISILRIINATHHNSGEYTCMAKNPLGKDSTTVQIVINVELKWKKVPRDTEIGLNQDVTLECDAIGMPEPRIEWLKHPSSLNDSSWSSSAIHVGRGSSLKLNKAQHRDSGIYECLARNGADRDLRQIFQLKVRGPPKILPIATADSYPEGSTINLICTVSGGQRKGLELLWNINGDQIDDGKLKYQTADYPNVSLDGSDSDISIMKIRNATINNSGQYTCTAKNPHGEDSTSVKIVINVELKWKIIPKDVDIGVGHDAQLECDAIGSPQPTIEWRKLTDGRRNDSSQLVTRSSKLKLTRVHQTDASLYECLAKNGADEPLRKVVRVTVRGK